MISVACCNCLAVNFLMRSNLYSNCDLSIHTKKNYSKPKHRQRIIPTDLSLDNKYWRDIKQFIEKIESTYCITVFQQKGIFILYSKVDTPKKEWSTTNIIVSQLIESFWKIYRHAIINIGIFKKWAFIIWMKKI